MLATKIFFLPKRASRPNFDNLLLGRADILELLHHLKCITNMTKNVTQSAKYNYSTHISFGFFPNKMVTTTGDIRFFVKKIKRILFATKMHKTFHKICTIRFKGTPLSLQNQNMY